MNNDRILFVVLCSATSATSHVVLGQFKTCVLLLGSYLIFNSDPGFVSICGAVAALCGMSIYTSLNLKDKHESSSKQQQKPNLPLSKSTSAQDGADLDVKDDTNIV